MVLSPWPDKGLKGTVWGTQSSIPAIPSGIPQEGRTRTYTLEPNIPSMLHLGLLGSNGVNWCLLKATPPSPAPCGHLCLRAACWILVLPQGEFTQGGGVMGKKAECERKGVRGESG